MKIVTVVGARPQFVKAAAVSREIAKNRLIREVIVHTGQHFDHNMSNIFFEEMEIPAPQYFLDVNSLDHGAMTGRMLEKIEQVLVAERPDSVVVYGDTNSTLAGALAASKLHVPVVHVEAGLRSFNMSMPEEVNRVLTDRISSVLCCPTDHAVENLKREGFEAIGPSIHKTGDVMQDAALYYSQRSAARSTIVSRLGLRSGAYALCTIHRAENTDHEKSLTEIVEALNAIAQSITVVLPLHPRTRKLLSGLTATLQFDPIEPVGYFDMLELLKNSGIVLTDSGGVQKEAFFFSKPCVTLRRETEWLELLEAGVNVLAGADRDLIVQSFRTMLDRRPVFDPALYGSGGASRRIVEALPS
ncbi:MAG: UDP-N-acetylglucosamine 2-epimerase (non-hydrolyzing) [Thermoanaerobaculia bacterium]